MFSKKIHLGKAFGALAIGMASFATPMSANSAETVPILLCPFGCGPMAGDTISVSYTHLTLPTILLV